MRNLDLQHASAIFTSASVGSTHISLYACLATITNGYIFDLLNWTGTLELIRIDGSGGTQDGITNNTGGATINASDSVIGVGLTNTFIISGVSIIQSSVISCNISIISGGNVTSNYCTSLQEMTTTGSGTIIASYCLFGSVGGPTPITHGSAALLAFLQCTIVTGGATAIAGAGAGSIIIEDLSYPLTSAVAGTLTFSGGNTQNGNLITQNITSWPSTDIDINLADAAGSNNLTIQNSTPATLMNVNTLGFVTLPLQPSVLAYTSANVANVTGDGTVYTIIMNTERFDINGDFNTTTGTFTAPVTGKYAFTWNASAGDFAVGHTSFRNTLTTSNATYQGFSVNPFATQDVPATSINTNGSVICDMDITDTAFVTIEVGGGAKTVSNRGDAVNHGSRISIELVS